MNEYERRREWLVGLLEAYRETPAEAAEHKFIDKLLRISRAAAGSSDSEKRYHNLIVLRYITAKRYSVQKICQVVHVGRQRENYEKITGDAIDRLMILVFGIDGIRWTE